jgi:hypothetical protein
MLGPRTTKVRSLQGVQLNVAVSSVTHLSLYKPTATAIAPYLVAREQHGGQLRVRDDERVGVLERVARQRVCASWKRTLEVSDEIVM